MEDKTSTGTTAVEAPATDSPTKKVSKSKGKAQRSKAHHPPTSEMVHVAIKELKDRKGSSVQAIKKYIAATYKVDGEKFAPFIKRYLKSAVTSGAVVQTRGKGASGSFKLNTGKVEIKPKMIKAKPTRKAAPKKEKSVEKKIAVARKPPSAKKAAAVKKVAETVKKAAAAKKPAAKPAPARSKAVAERRSVSKSKKTAKAPAAKTKTPKPKKAAPSKTAKASAKK